MLNDKRVIGYSDAGDFIFTFFVYGKVCSAYRLPVVRLVFFAERRRSYRPLSAEHDAVCSGIPQLRIVKRKRADFSYRIGKGVFGAVLIVIESGTAHKSIAFYRCKHVAEVDRGQNRTACKRSVRNYFYFRHYYFGKKRTFDESHSSHYFD